MTRRNLNMSAKQYNMLRIALQEKVFSIDAATKYLQPTFTSMARRSYLAVDVNSKTGEMEFRVTATAREAMARYENSDVMRTRESSSLSQFLDRYVKRSQRRANADRIEEPRRATV